MARVSTSALREARRNAGLKQEELAQRLGVHRNTIGNAERGAHEPSFGLMLRLAETLGVPLESLVRNGSEPEQEA